MPLAYAPVQWLGFLTLVGIAAILFWDWKPWRYPRAFFERRAESELPDLPERKCVVHATDKDDTPFDLADVTWPAPTGAKWILVQDSDGTVYSYNPERDAWEVVS